MFVIVVGCGKIGYHLSRALLAAGHEVVVLERDSQRAATATDELGSIVISSDGSEPNVLSEAGASRCQMLIATTADDATNLVACQVAKSSFNVPHTIAVVSDPDRVPLFKRLGVDVTISTTELILSHIEEELPGGPLIHVLPLHGASNGIVCVRVPAGSPAIGRSLSGLRLPPGTSLVSIVSKDGELRSVSDSSPLQEDDEIVAITPPDKEQQLWVTLTGGA
ncbi:MAG: TrkA family potassium uptake protein [Chloroflexi bacterium]|nr:TrkA family potassium uptake protein [Chloroflexota bacterium]